MIKAIGYAHTHWDREWYREFEEFRLRLCEVMDGIFEELEAENLDAFYFDGQTGALEDYLELYPEKLEYVKGLVERKKLYIGPFFCSSDEFLVNAESLVRNLCFGIKKSKEFGCKDFIAYLSDTFGHGASTPSVLKSFRIDKAVMWRGLGGLPSEFMWDGVKAVYLKEGYFHDVLSQNVDCEKKAEYIQKYIEKIADKTSEYVLFPFGADHLALAKDVKSQIANINKILEGAEVNVGTPFEYFEKVERRFSQKDVSGELLDCSRNFLLKGVFSSRIYLKQRNAALEWGLNRVTEPLGAVMTNLCGIKSYQKSIDMAYKELVKNHAHDSIYGCGVDAIHDEMMTRFSKIEQIENGVQKRILRDITLGKKLKVINLSSFQYSGAVELECDFKLPKSYNAQLVRKKRAFPDSKLFDPSQIPITEDITEIYTYLVQAENLAPLSVSELSGSASKTSLKVSETSIENENLRLEVEKNGKITVFDKIAGMKYKDFLRIQDIADIGDSYTFGALKNDKPLFAEFLRSKIIEKGHLRSILRLFYEIKIPKTSSKIGRSQSSLKHLLAIDVVLFDGAKNLEFKLSWENKSENHRLQVAFSLPEKITTSYSKDALCVVKRDFDPDYDISALVPAPRGVELKTNTMPMQGFVCAQGVGVLTKGLYEYEVFKNSLKITVLRSTGIISEPKNPCRGTPAGPPLETPALQSLGCQEAEFAVSFVKEPKTLYSRLEEYYKPVVAVFSGLKPQKFISLDNPEILISAIKNSSNDDENALMIRLYNSSSREQKLNFKTELNCKKIFISNPLEESVSEFKNPIMLAPKEILTLKLLS